MSEVMVITGSRKGIGRYLVDYYLQHGYVVSGCSREPFDSPPSNYEHYCLDVGDGEAVSRMVQAVCARHTKIDILINNAGVASMNHALLTPLTALQRVFKTNVFGTFLFAREIAKRMLRSEYGRIVNFATVATPLNLEGEAAYAASKASVESLTRVLARELSPFNITVNAVGPSPVETDLIRGVSKEKIAALIDRQAVKRLGTFRDISNAIDFFIRPESDFVTGQVLYLGGIS